MSNVAKDRKVWDVPVRLFHWSLVILVLVLWLSGEFGGFDIAFSAPWGGDVYLSNMDVHSLAGQGVFVLVVFRLLWGLWGSTTARFGHFIHHPVAVAGELMSLLKGRVQDSVGHNPLGGLMVLALLLVLLGQSVSGLFAADDLFFEGPLAHLVSDDAIDSATDLHHLFFSFLQVLVVLHIAAVFYYLLRRKNLIKPMVTGSKGHPVEESLSFSPWWLAALSLVIAAGLLWGLRSL